MKKKGDIEVIGLMSGTSLDGLDMAWCRFSDPENTSFTVLDAKTIQYPADLTSSLANSVTLGAEELFALDAELGKWIGNALADFVKDGSSRPDLIASHGHTVFHQPERGFTVQIGNPAHIYAATGIRIISDFRSLDVALGGQGAPLVPIGDELLFSEYTYCLNLGGIANISFRQEGKRKAYDICACNMVLNYLSRREDLEFDRGGALARNGNIIPTMLEQFNNWSYLTGPPPKSLGFEQISSELFPILSSDVSTKDLLRTFTEHITDQISIACDHGGSLLMTGGGAHNDFLRERLAAKRPDLQLVYPDSLIVNFKEAIVFAFLGALHEWGKVNVLSSVTGAERDHISGLALG